MATFALILAVMAPAAFAQSGGEGYGEKGPSVLGQTEGNSGGDNGDNPSNGQGTAPGTDSAKGDSAKGAAANGTRSASGDSLPFTGLDLGLVAAAGASLMLLGAGMRRLTRAPDSV
ncbi:MAG: hypothetical protein ACR2J6_08745 [Thermoleophilaceae bacterium]